MPYIEPKRRSDLRFIVDELFEKLNRSGNQKGEYNYCITRLFYQFIKAKGINYSTLSDVSGILTDIQFDFQRVIVSNYEKVKKEENGKIGVFTDDKTKYIEE